MSLGIGPDPPRSLARGGGFEDGRGGGLQVEAGDMAAGQGGVVDLSVRGGGNAVWPPAPWSLEDLYLADRRVQATVEAALAGEPEDAISIKGGCVQVGIAAAGGQGETLNRLGGRVYADDGVQAAVGNPGGAIRPDDDAVRGGPLS